MLFLSDNNARVHPKVWQAMQAADAPDVPYDADSLSKRMDEAFSHVFGRDCAALWAGSGTAANCLGLGTMVSPHGGVICHEEAHIETSEGGAPGFFLHGAKLMLVGGEGAKLTPEAIAAKLASIRGGVHYVQPQAISISQVSEFGLAYAPEELTVIGELAGAQGLGLHMDGARFANAAAYLGCSPTEAAGPADTLAFGCVKNGGMNAEALVLFDPEQADLVRWRRKRAGHLSSKGRFMAAQVQALVEGGLWLDNARHSNAMAALVAAGAGERLLHPVQSNELFIRMNGPERDALRRQGFGFYDWDDVCIRVVAAWDTLPDHAEALGKAIASL